MSVLMLSHKKNTEVFLSSFDYTEEFRQHWPSSIPSQYIEQRRIYKFTSEPDGLLLRLMNAILKQKYIKEEYIFKRGFICQIQHNNQKALIEYHSDHLQLDVNLRLPLLCDITSKGGMLLRKITDTIEIILESYYPRLREQVERLIPCCHCLARKYENEPFNFTYEECIEAVVSGYPIVYCNNIASRSRCVQMEYLAPDITLIGFPYIRESDLEMKEEIGQGSFGKVFKGRISLKVSLLVAIKTIKFSRSTGNLIFWEFQQESKIMSKINHENLVKLYGVTVNPPMMVMEFISGGDLFNLIHPLDKNDPSNRTRFDTSPDSYSWKLRMKIAFDIAKGMQYLHNLSPPIVHRDLRSPNIFIVSLKENEKVNAKVADFGLAKELINNQIAGTLSSWQWLPPEIISDNEGYEYDQSIDIYSFAVILWELVSFKYPYDEFQNEVRFQRQIVDGNGDPITMLNISEVKEAIISENLRPTIPEFCSHLIRNLIENCWSGFPDHRPNFNHIVDVLSIELKLPIENRNENSFKKRKLSPDLIYRRNTVIDEMKLKSIVIPFSWIDIQNRYGVYLLHHEVSNSVWIGCNDGTILIFDSFTKKQKGGIGIHRHRISEMVIFGDQIWSCSVDGTIQVIDVQTQQRIALLTHPIANPIKCMCKVSTDINNTTIWSSSLNDSTLYIWKPNFSLHESIDLLKIVTSMTVSKEIVFVGMECGEISCVNTELKNNFSWDAHSSAVTSLLCISDSLIWSGSKQGEISTWLLNGECVLRKGTKKLHVNEISSLNLIGKYVWSASDRSIILWDLETFKPLQEIYEFHKEAITSVRLVNNNVWTTSVDALVALWKFGENITEKGTNSNSNFKRALVKHQSKPVIGRKIVVGRNRSQSEIVQGSAKHNILRDEDDDDNEMMNFEGEEEIPQKVIVRRATIVHKKEKEKKSGGILSSKIFKKQEKCK